MLVSRQLQLHWEVLKWLGILALAVAAAVIFARQISSGI